MFRIKICGVTSPADAIMAADAGADAIGLNFFARSVRHVTLDQAAQIAAAIGSSVQRVGVFVDASVDAVQTAAARVPLDVVQLHGHEPPELAAQLSDAGLSVVRAIRCSAATVDQPLAWLESLGPHRLQAILIDAEQHDAFGGTGRQADWSVVERIRSVHPRLPIVLAGGLNPTNVALAITSARPDGVDVASGVESSPGVKNPQLVRDFVEAARSALRRIKTDSQQL